MIILGTNSVKDTGFDVANSCRFNAADGAFMSITPGSNMNLKRWTWSSWIKRGGQAGEQNIFCANNASSDYQNLMIDANGQVNFLNYVSNNVRGRKQTTARLRDSSAWYHIVCVWDSANSTAEDRMQIYINGVRQTAFGDNDNPAEDQVGQLGESGVATLVGAFVGTSANFWDGYMAEVVLIDGSALAPTSFGEFDEDSGIWKPIDVSGLTFGTHGFYLDFEASDNLGNNANGGADLGETNIAATDQSTDTCTNNFATLNILNMNNSGYVFSEGNLKGAVSGAWLGGTSTFFVNKGKWYWEVKYGSGNFGLGIGQAETDATAIKLVSTANHGYVSYHVGGFEFFQNGSDTFNRTNNGNIGSYGSQATSGQIVMIAYDADSGKLFAGRQGTFFNSSNPANGTSPMFTVTSAAYFTPSLSIEGGVHEMNFGSPPYSESGGETDADGYGNFAYEPPSGFFSLCTKNLAEYG